MRITKHLGRPYNSTLPYLATYIPTTLITPHPYTTLTSLPITVNSLHGSTFEIANNGESQTGDRDFWGVLKEKIELWTGTVKEQTLGALSKEELEMLKGYTSILPGMLGQDGRLLYDHISTTR